MTALQDHPGQALAGQTCTVLGGGGFIGTAVVRAALEAGAAVKAFGRGARPARLDPRAVWISGGLGDDGAVSAAVQGSTLVVHLAGTSDPAASERAPAADLAGEVLTTLSVVDAAAAQGVERVLFASSGGTVYGVTDGRPVPETAPTEPISAYGLSKLTVEKYLALFSRRRGLDYRILRIANAYGPGQSPVRGQGVVAAMLHRAIRRETIEIWGDGSVVRDFVHVDDVAAAFVSAAVHRGPGRVFNIASGEGRSLASIAADLARLPGLDGVRCAYRAGRPADVPVNVLDIALAQSELGWTPRTAWLDGLAGTVDWLKAACPAG